MSQSDLDNVGSIVGNALVPALVSYAVGGPFLVPFYTGLVIGGIGLATAPEPDEPGSFDASQVGRQVMLRTSTAPRRVILGRAKVSGPLIFAATRDAAKQNEVLSLVVALAGHEVDQVGTPEYNHRTEGSLAAFEKRARRREVWASFSVLPLTIQFTVGGRSSTYNSIATHGDLAAAIAADPDPPVSIIATGSASGDSMVSGAVEYEAWTTGELIDIQYTLQPVGTYIYLTEYTTDPSGAVASRVYTGTSTQAADSVLVATVPAWTNAHQLLDTAYLVCDLHHNPSAWPTGVPTPRAEVRGARVYDPRLDSTNGGSGAQRVADPATWAWSDNWALNVAWYLMSEHGLSADATEIDWPSVIVAANICDEIVQPRATVEARIDAGVTNQLTTTWEVDLGGGIVVTIENPHGFVAGDEFVISDTTTGLDGSVLTVTSVTDDYRIVVDGLGGTVWLGEATLTPRQRRYTCNGAYTLDQDPLQVLEALRLAGGPGEVLWFGQWHIFAGAAAVPEAFTLTADHLRGDIEYQARPGRADLFNAVRGTFVDRADYDQRTDFPPITSATYEAEDGEQIFKDVNLPFVDDAYRAQRIAVAMLRDHREGLQVSLPVKLSAGMRLRPWDVVPVTIASLGWTDKLFRVTGWALTYSDAEGYGVDLSLKAYNAAIWDWAPGDAVTIIPSRATSLADPRVVAAPTGLALAPTGEEFVRRAGDGTILVMARLEWASSDAYAQEFDVRWRRPDAISVFEYQRGVRAHGTTIGPLVPGNHQVEVRARNTLGAESDWTQALIVISGKSAPPLDVSSLTATIQGSAVVLTVGPWTESDIEAVEIRAGGTGWDDATLIDAGLQRRFLIDALPTATTTYRAKLLDTSGNYSTNAVSTTFTPVVRGAVTAVASTVDVASAAVRLTWTPPTTGSYPIVGYQVRRGGSDWDSADILGETAKPIFLDTDLPTASATYRIRAVDAAGVLGAERVHAFTVTAPPAPSALSADSNSRTAVVTVSWTQTATTYPVRQWQIRRGPLGGDVASATDLGAVDATRWAGEEPDGHWVFYVRAVDVVGRVGAWASDDVIASYLARHAWAENEWFRPHDLATGNEWGTACAVSRGGQVAVASSGFNGATTPDHVLAMAAVGGGMLSLQRVLPASPIRFGAYTDSLAMSANGDRLFVADAPSAAGSAGRAYVYRRELGAYAEEANRSFGGGSSLIVARSVATDAAGAVLAVPDILGSSGTYSIRVHIEKRSGTTWTAYGNVTASGSTTTADEIEASVDLSGDGTILLLEANLSAANRSTQVYVDSGSAYGASPVATIARSLHANAGLQSAISLDGEWIASPSGVTNGELEIWQADQVPAPTGYTKVFASTTGRACRSVRINRPGTVVLAVEMSSTQAFVVFYQRGSAGWFKLKEVLMTATFGSLATSKLGYASCLSDDVSVVLIGDPDADKLWSFSAQPMQG